MIIGGPGSDRIDLSRSPKRVVVHLAGGTADGEGHDVLDKIENATGSRYGDRIKGTPAPNGLYGGAGAEVLISGGGNDFLDGGDGGDTLNAGAGDDQVYAGPGTDTIDGGPGFDSCLGGEPNRVRNCEVP